MNAKILVVDDQRDLLELLTLSLEQEGYSVATALNAAQATEQIEKGRPDIILLDILLPDISGIRLTAKLKNDAQTAHIPVILLTAKDSETDIVVGLSVGADDYITKPFSTKVLLARIEAVLRRVYAAQPGQDVQHAISAGPVKIFQSGRKVFVDGKPLELTAAEYRLLEAMINAKGSIVTRKELSQTLPASGQGQNERVVDVHIASMRKKMGNARNYIRTVHGQGYRVDF